jgi:hypothetical protein
MGTWGAGPTASDEAYDFLGDFFGDLFGPEKVQQLREAFRFSDAYGSIRAGAHVLQMLGDTLHWPREQHEELKELLDLAVRRLTAMITPAGDRPTDFVASWLREGTRKEAVASVREQIEDLQRKRQALG